MRRGVLIVVAIVVIAIIGFISIQSNRSRENGDGIVNDIPEEGNKEVIIPSRESKIPGDAVKITPETDKHPPITVSPEYEHPVPLPYPINTRGAEDSAYMLPSGETLYFWFTPDIHGDVHAQAVDLVTGIYVTEKQGDQWSAPERVWLCEPGTPVLDGCAFIDDGKMWFCSVREGYTDLHWFIADYIDGEWTSWILSDFEPSYMVGELHIVGDELFFHSSKPGEGGYDIWLSERVGVEWGEPSSIYSVNSELSEGWPWVSPDGMEMWFTRLEGAPNLYRTKRVSGEWTEPELMIKTFAGEPSLDSHGNVYFTHHYYDDEGNMLEADIYVAYKKDLPLKGVSVSPKSFEPYDFQHFLQMVEETQDVLLWVGDWMEVYDEGAPKTFTELGQLYDYTPIIEVGHYIQDTGELFRPFGDYRQVYLESTIEFVSRYRPPYFGIGVETNIFARKNPEAFEEFVPFYNQVYDEIKKASPNTKVFTVFQLETMKGLDMWEIQENEPHWGMIDRFKHDIVAFTTYPGLFYRNVSDIPMDHYLEILSHTSKPIAFTEIGWHSAGSPAGWESSETEQAEYINLFYDLTGNMQVEVAVWSFMYDPDIFEPFDSMGLISKEGHKRLAWTAWNKE
jgi:hypothetical protein